MPVAAAELKERYGDLVFDSVEVKAPEDEMLGFAAACGETDPRFLDTSRPDFQAPVNFACRYHGARMLPEDFPDFDRAMMIDAGKAVTVHTSMRRFGTSSTSPSTKSRWSNPSRMCRKPSPR